MLAVMRDSILMNWNIIAFKHDEDGSIIVAAFTKLPDFNPPRTEILIWRYFVHQADIGIRQLEVIWIAAAARCKMSAAACGMLKVS
jgi:uncharacterized SAM-dependent methyltransferase